MEPSTDFSNKNSNNPNYYFATSQISTKNI